MPDRDQSLAPADIDLALAHAITTLTTNPRDASLAGGRPFLVKVTDDHGVWRLRRWPVGTPEARVRFAQAVSRALAADEHPVQLGLTLSHGVFVDRQPWRPGDALAGRPRRLPDGHAFHAPGELDLARERALVRAIANLHDRTAALAADVDAPIAPVDRVLQFVQREWRAARERLRPITREHPPIQRWLRVSEQLLPAAEEAINAAAPSFRPPVTAHLNLWPGHAIANEDEINLIDFSGASVSTALLDIAQAVTRFNGWTGQTAERVLGEYASHMPLGPDERRVLPAFAAMDLVIESSRLLSFGYGRGDEHASAVSQTARAGALHMLNSMDALHPAVVRASDPVPYAKRKRLAKHAGQPARRPPRR